MELKGLAIALYPVAIQGAGNPKGVDPGPAVERFLSEMGKKLAKAGMDVRHPSEGGSDQGFSILTRLVTIDPGSSGKRILLGPLLTKLAGGAAVLEVEGQIGHGSAPLARLRAVGKNYNSTEKAAMKYCSVYAGTVMARQIIKVLKAR